MLEEVTLPDEDALARLRTELDSDQDLVGLSASTDQVEQAVRDWWTTVYLPWFTDHGPEHSRRVARFALQLGDILWLRPDRRRLTPLERYILHVAAWLHDLGMNDVSLSPRPLGEMTKKDFNRVRHEHPDRTASLLLNDYAKFGLPDGDFVLADAVALTARGHGTEYYRDSVSQLRSLDRVRNREIRGPLLASLLLMADELDLHYQRAMPLPGGAKLPPVSEAHAFKHQCVSSAWLELNVEGRVGIGLKLTFPAGLPEEDQLDVERWITVKLQRQIGMVEPEILEGFSGRLRFDRAINVGYRAPGAARPQPSRESLAIIRAEAARDEMIDHREALRQILTAINSGNIVLISGVWQPGEDRDMDGREDLLGAAAAAVAANGVILRMSSRLRLNRAGEVSDILEEWLASIFHEGRPRCPLTWADAGDGLHPLGEAPGGAIGRRAVASPQVKVDTCKLMSVSSGP